MSGHLDPYFGRFDDVCWWLADPLETMQRASCALDVGERRLAVDPVDCEGLDEELAADGGLDGVVVLMDRHSRDARTIAARHEVPVYVPAGAERIAAAVGGPVAELDPILEGSSLELIPVTSGRLGEELALWRSADGTLIVPESLGTADHFTAGGERVGVHPMMRLWPPREPLMGLSARRLVTGHGRPIVDLDDGEVDASLAAARRRLPRAWIGAITAWIR